MYTNINSHVYIIRIIIKPKIMYKPKNKIITIIYDMNNIKLVKIQAIGISAIA